MERIHREQPKVEDVLFVPVVEQNCVEYRGEKGGFGAIDNLPVDTMEGLMVPTDIPEGYYAEAPAQDGGNSGEGTGSEDVEGEPVREEDIVKGGKFVLGNDITATTCLAIEDGVSTEINLNKKTIVGGIFTENNGVFSEGSNDSYAFYVKKGGNLTINGEGTVEAQEAKYSMAVWARGGNVTINGGLYKNAGNGCDLIYASEGAEIIINGGEFIATRNNGADAAKNEYNVLNLKDKSGSKITVYGGKFHGFDPANNLSENPAISFVADGYKSVETSEGIWEVMPA